MLLEDWRSVHQMYKRRSEGHLEIYLDHIILLCERFETWFYTSLVAPEWKPSGGLVRVGKRPSLPLVDPFRIHRL